MYNSEYYIQDNSDIEETKLETAKGLYQVGNYAGALKIYLDMVNASYSHKLYYEMDSYLEHIKKCSEPKCNYESRESHFFKNGYCFQCRLEDLWGGEYENE